MGSLNASGVPVVSKTSYTYRQLDNRIKRTNSVDDAESLLVSGPVSSVVPSQVIGSGSLVRDNGVVDYYEEVVYGNYMMGRSATARVASDTGNARSVVVDLGDNRTDAIIETALSGVTPRLTHKHVGRRIQENDTDATTVRERIPNSGVYDDGFPL